MPKRPDYISVIGALEIVQHLAAYTPAVIGTPPLGLAVPDSDIDIACCAPDLAAFEADLRRCFGRLPGFAIERLTVRAVPSLVCRFTSARWMVEIFGQDVPVAAQYGVRHFAIEQRLLELFGAEFRTRVIALKTEGVKTEPAFAQLLGLDGDPYEALLKLESWPDDRLTALRPAGPTGWARR